MTHGNVPRNFTHDFYGRMHLRWTTISNDERDVIRQEPSAPLPLRIKRIWHFRKLLLTVTVFGGAWRDRFSRPVVPKPGLHVFNFSAQMSACFNNSRHQTCDSAKCFQFASRRGSTPYFEVCAGVVSGTMSLQAGRSKSCQIAIQSTKLWSRSAFKLYSNRNVVLP